MALFGPKPPVDNPAGNSPTEPWVPVSPAPTVREQHHAEILAAFERSADELAQAEGQLGRAQDLVEETGRNVVQAQAALDEKRPLLRRVAEGHI